MTLPPMATDLHFAVHQVPVPTATLHLAALFTAIVGRQLPHMNDLHIVALASFSSVLWVQGTRGG